MDKCFNFRRFLRYLLDDEILAEMGARFTKALDALFNKPQVDANEHPKWSLYSGLFLLLKQKLRLPNKQAEAVAIAAASAFGNLVCGNVRSFV